MLHPTVRLLLWSAMVTATQLLPLYWLLAAGAPLLLFALLLSRTHMLLLLGRTRWLLLSVAVLFSLATPGVFLLPELGNLGPTWEGAVLGLTHLLRLMLVLAALALLLQFTPIGQLVAGLYGALRPFSWLGLDRGRIAVRLMLVLRYIEQAPHGGNWREWLEGAEISADANAVKIPSAPFAPADYAALACLGAGITYVVLA